MLTTVVYILALSGVAAYALREEVRRKRRQRWEEERRRRDEAASLPDLGASITLQYESVQELPPDDLRGWRLAGEVGAFYFALAATFLMLFLPAEYGVPLLAAASGWQVTLTVQEVRGR